MGVSWCIEFCSHYDLSRDDFVQQWSTFCRVGGCDDFVVPFDRVLHRFRRSAAGVTVETSDGDAVVDGIGQLQFPSGTYSEVESLFDGYELFVPDHGPFRAALDDTLIWQFRRVVSLDELLPLGDHGKLGQHFAAAARYAWEHHLVIRVSY